MSRISIILLQFTVLWIGVGDCYTTEDMELSTSVPVYEPSPESERNEYESSLFSTERLNKAIEIIEQVSISAEKTYLEGILPIEETEKIYDEMNSNFVDIIDMLANPNNAYEFLKAKGLDRIIITNIGTPYTPLRTNILMLLYTLFNLAPSTTNAVMPARLIDKVLDIFVNDDDLGVKARVIDILYIWLPENPRVQARIMKVKGLVPFYEQMTKLDIQSIYKLLDLFNTILKEHLDVRYKKAQRSKRDADELKLYQRIGLIEHMSRKDICNGLLEIFRSTWQTSAPENDVIVPVLDLSTKIAPMCLKSFKGKPEAEELFDALLKYLKEKNRDEYLAKFDMNATNIENVITDYINSLKQANEIKDEF